MLFSVESDRAERFCLAGLQYLCVIANLGHLLFSPHHFLSLILFHSFPLSFLLLRCCDVHVLLLDSSRTVPNYEHQFLLPFFLVKGEVRLWFLQVGTEPYACPQWQRFCELTKFKAQNFWTSLKNNLTWCCVLKKVFFLFLGWPVCIPLLQLYPFWQTSSWLCCRMEMFD